MAKVKVKDEKSLEEAKEKLRGVVNFRQTKWGVVAAKAKRAVTPDKALEKFSKTLEGKTFKHINSCITNNNFFEAYFFQWALIEQILIVQLIEFIAKNLKINIPESLWRSNQLAINNFYLAISQNVGLYRNLERGRKERNKIIHELVKNHYADLLEKKIKESLKYDFLNITDEIFKRLTGKKVIPVLSLYSKGWNDCLQKTKEIIIRKLNKRSFNGKNKTT